MMGDIGEGGGKQRPPGVEPVPSPVDSELTRWARINQERVLLLAPGKDPSEELAMVGWLVGWLAGGSSCRYPSSARRGGVSNERATDAWASEELYVVVSTELRRSCRDPGGYQLLAEPRRRRLWHMRARGD